MTAPLTGYTASLPSDVLIDSGVLYVGASVFGALTGGLKFDPGVEYRAVEFDGRRSPMKGLDRKAMFMPKLSGTMIQLSTTNIAQVEPGATVAGTGAWTGTAASSYAPRQAGVFMSAGDYLSDVRAVWLRGAGTYVQVRFPSALLTKYDITSQDGAEVAIALEIEARLDITLSGFTGIGTAPYRIEMLSTL